MRSARRPRASVAVPAARFVLPVSGIAVSLRQPTGAEDLLLADQRCEDPALALALAEKLGRTEPQRDWSGLTITDIDTLIMRLRQAVVGDRVSASVTCGVADCGSRVELSFSIDAYLDHHRPGSSQPPRRRGWSVAPCADAPDWFALCGRDGEQARFRLPLLADQIAVAGLPDAVAALAARCIRPVGLSVRLQARVEAEMAALAPPLAGPLHGRCPDCGTPIAARFEARLYCLQELRDRARFVYDDIDTLAERYHWSERAILTLPYTRRANYAERARQAARG